MTPKDQNDMENLSRAIVEAIMSSGGVKQALEKMNMSMEGFGKNFMVFMVNLDAVSEIKNREIKPEEASEEMPKPRRRKPAKKSDQPEVIDGQALSNNEKKFQDYLSEHFDTETWLKRLKLRLE